MLSVRRYQLRIVKRLLCCRQVLLKLFSCLHLLLNQISFLNRSLLCCDSSYLIRTADPFIQHLLIVFQALLRDQVLLLEELVFWAWSPLLLLLLLLVFFRRGWPRTITWSYNEIVYLGEDLNVPAIVHHNDVIVIRAVIVLLDYLTWGSLTLRYLQVLLPTTGFL